MPFPEAGFGALVKKSHLFVDLEAVDGWLKEGKKPRQSDSDVILQFRYVLLR